MTFEEEQLQLLERYSVKGFVQSEYGYVIQPDGTIWSLTCKWTHGVILALLYPLEAIKYGYGVPDRDANVFHFQRFELSASYHLNCIRVGLNGVLTEWYVSKGNAPITEGQRRALRSIFEDYNLEWNTVVNTNYGDVTLVRLFEHLQLEESNESKVLGADEDEGPTLLDTTVKVATRDDAPILKGDYDEAW